jgi:hypothetical protein
VADLRLEGQTGTPLYMTEPPGPTYSGEVRPSGQHIEVRLENGTAWFRHRLSSSRWTLWKAMDRDG